MPLIALDIKIEKKNYIWSQEFLRGKWSTIKKESMRALAQFYLDEIFPKHFAAGNKSQYQHDPRNPFYLDVVKRIEGEGDGKRVDLILKGKSRRWLRTSAKITATSNRATLTMSGPNYFTNPHVGSVQKQITNKDGRERTITINIRHQPDKKRELQTISNNDRTMLNNFVHAEIANRIKRIIFG